MLIANGIAMLEISATVMGQTTVIYPTLLSQGEHAILIDTGYPGQLPMIQKAMDAVGKPLDMLTDLILTHQDIDHIGGLPALNSIPRPRPVVTWASAIERPYIQGDKMLLKITPEVVDKAVASLPKEMPEERRSAFRHALLNPPKGPVDRLIGFGEACSPFEGITILDTPGHTPGHISIYHPASATLVAGDALVLTNGQLNLPDFALNSDHALALESLRQLADLDIEGVICYHGGYFKGDVRARISELLA